MDVYVAHTHTHTQQKTENSKLYTHAIIADIWSFTHSLNQLEPARKQPRCKLMRHIQTQFSTWTHFSRSYPRFIGWMGNLDLRFHAFAYTQFRYEIFSLIFVPHPKKNNERKKTKKKRGKNDTSRWNSRSISRKIKLHICRCSKALARTCEKSKIEHTQTPSVQLCW